MKTIRQISEEIGVSKQAIHKKIKQKPLSTSLQGLTSTVDGRLTISVDGETLIKQAFEQNTVNQIRQPVDESSTKTVNQVDGEVIKLLQKNIEILQMQLEVKDKQIEDLTVTVRTQAESIKVDRNNELAGTLIAGQNKLLSNSHKWWQFWKNNK